MNKIYILGHENPDVDSIVSGHILEEILTKKGYKAEFIIPDKKIEYETMSICKKFGLNPLNYKKENFDLANKNNKYILVDHNERELGGEIVCIIDHHPTSKKIKLKHYYNKKKSSTACLIAKDNEKLLNKDHLQLAIVATLVDTASFHSTKSRIEDECWVKELCKKYNFDYEYLYKVGLCLTNVKDLKKSSLNGLKKYNYDKYKVGSSYIQIESISEEELKKIIDTLKKYVCSKKLDAFVFIVHNMKIFKTKYYFITKDNIEERGFDSYTSRGNTIMPEIEKKLIKYKKRSF